MKLLHQIKDSIYCPEFYSKQKAVSIGSAFGYFFILLLIISVFATLLVALLHGPKVNKLISKEFVSQVISYYPAELEITIKGGHVSVNVEEPYAIPIPADMAKGSVRDVSVSNLLVIDTVRPLVVEDFAKYRTLALLSRDFIVFQEKNGKITIEPLGAMPDMTINRITITELIAEVLPYLKIVIPFILVGVVIGWFIGNVAMYLFILLISSLILWIVYKLQKKHLSYGTCYKLGLYAATAAMVADLVFIAAQVHIPWYVDLIIIIVVIFANEHESGSSH